MKPDKSKAYVMYAYDILDGRIPACVHIKNACRRFLDDFERDDLQFNYAKVDRVISFVQILKHHDAPPGIVNTPIILSDWQVFIVSNIFGWEYKETGIRRFSRSYIEVARKNAKTQLMAALGMFSMIEYVSANQILLTANTREQAGRLFDFCKAFAKQLDPSGKQLKVLRDRILFKETGAYVVVLSSDAKTADGYNAAFATIDELHEAPDSKSVDVIRSGQVKPGAHLAMITTAGFNSNSYCHSLRNIVADVLARRAEDDRLFGLIYTVDTEDLEGDNWQNRDIWIKASPNIGKSAPYEFYEDCLTASKISPTDALNFKVKNLNIWGSDAANIWIPGGYVDKCRGKIDFETWRDDFVTIGVDLSAVHDLTAVSYCHYDKKNDKIEFHTEYYLPETCLHDSENKDFYKRMYLENRLNLTQGNVVDYDKITNDIVEHQKKYGYVCLSIGYDSWNATQFAVNQQSMGFRMKPISQSLGAMNRGVKELERRIYSEKCVIDDNQITSWMFSNAVLRVDGNGNTKPTKCVNASGNAVGMRKIDGIIAMLNALIVLLEDGQVVFID